MAGRFGRKYQKDEDLEEEDVWGVMEDSENSSPKLRKPLKNSSLLFSSSSSSPRMIPRSSSSIIEASSYGKQSSGPVDIPDWSKIYGKTSKKKKKNGIISASSSSWVNYGYGHDGCYANSDYHHHHHLNGYYNDGHDDGDGHDDDDEDDDDGMVPPHEYLARKLARSQISSFSVYEGIGRTLKGRDLSKVRNTILTKTGFLE